MKKEYIEKGVKLEGCLTNGRNKGVKITFVTTANEHADLAYEMIQNIFKMVDVNAVGSQKPDGKKVKDLCLVKFKKEEKSETAFLNALPKLQRRVQKPLDWVAVYQTMIRMGIIYPVEFINWLKWLNPICLVKLGKLPMSMSSARRIPSVLLDYKVEWEADTLVKSLMENDKSETAAKQCVTHLTKRIEIIRDLLSDI